MSSCSDVGWGGGLFLLRPKNVSRLHPPSEEELGAHDTLHKYQKHELAVPLRLLPLSSVKHRLARDVSQTPATAHRARQLGSLPALPPQACRGAVNASTLTGLDFALFTSDVSLLTF